MIRQVFNIDSGVYQQAGNASYKKATGVALQMGQLQLKSEHFKSVPWHPGETADGKPAVLSGTFIKRENAVAVANALTVLGVVKPDISTVKNFGGSWTVAVPVAEINMNMLQRRKIADAVPTKKAKAEPGA